MVITSEREQSAINAKRSNININRIGEAATVSRSIVAQNEVFLVWVWWRFSRSCRNRPSKSQAASNLFWVRALAPARPTPNVRRAHKLGTCCSSGELLPYQASFHKPQRNPTNASPPLTVAERRRSTNRMYSTARVLVWHVVRFSAPVKIGKDLP